MNERPEIKDDRSLEETIREAIAESVSGTRRGDKAGESEEIRKYIAGCRRIVVPNRNDIKISAINDVLAGFGLFPAEHLEIHTDCCDVSRLPALTKALMALDVTDAELVIARGRLGVPGSGSILVILDCKGRLLSAALSPSHHIHGRDVYEAVRDEMTTALERIGFRRPQ